MSHGLQFAIFSFNRGRFLQHCVDSIERFAPECSVHVVDDGSDDPHTRRVVDTLAQRHRVTIADKAGTTKHGGLYTNMQYALDSAKPDQPLCFLQDDAQLVRPLEAEDFDAINRFFWHSPRAAF